MKIIYINCGIILTTILSCISSDILFKGFTKNCVVSNGFVDPHLGLFNNTSKYCDPRCFRGLICCNPQSLQEINTRFYLSNRYMKDKPILWSDRRVKQLLTRGRVVFLIHGWLEDYSISSWVNLTRDAWLRRDVNANVIVVDWGQANKLIYFQSVANVRVVGAIVGYMVVNLGISERTELVGMSLGAQIIGEAGKWVKRSRKMLKKCTGLDPAGPGFDGCPNNVRLDRSDCEVVLIIHTDTIRSGTNRKSGHCDYWINCGHDQPYCPPSLGEFMKTLASFDEKKVLTFIGAKGIACSHMRAPEIYYYQLNRTCRFLGTVCTNCEKWPQEQCYSDVNVNVMPLPPDDYCKTNFNVNLLIKTGVTPPFC